MNSSEVRRHVAGGGQRPILGQHINGRAIDGSDRRGADIFDPSTGQVSASLTFAGPEQVRAAIDAAREAGPGWAGTPAVQRARVLFSFRALLDRHREELAQIISSEHGKVLADARGELVRGAEVVEFACGIPHLMKGEYSDSIGRGIDSWSLRQPVGVCAGITPFNFPAMVPLWMFPISIACGNTFVLKPSEKVPTCALRLAELLIEAGLPSGVFNVVNGDQAVAEALVTDPDVAAVSFVGSTAVARRVYEQAARHGKRAQALGGAKNHLVVMPDADPHGAAQALMGAAFGSAGERCMAISVAVAVGDAADRLIEALRPMLTALHIGPSLSAQSDMGPLITRQHLDRVRDYIGVGVQEGAELVVDGRTHDVGDTGGGFFLGPSLFDRVEPHMRIYKEEIFGPVLAVVRVPDLERALQRVNEHEYGNGAAIYTASGETARRFCHSVQAGMVGVNVPIPAPMAFHSFGGWKRSLFGDLPMHGTEGVRFYTRLKTVTSRWPPSGREAAEFAMPTMK